MKFTKPNNYFYLFLSLIALFSVPQLMASDYDYGYAYSNNPNIVDIDVVSDYGRHFKQYPVNSRKRSVKRSYLEAKDGKSYGIKVKNKSNERIGLVIAVDGRNIISGKKSYLKSNERMYILNPYQHSTYKGWRSNRNRVNEFYFTDVPDSYADRTFGDTSAMGVIAVAVFKEKNGRWYQEREYDYDTYSRHRDYRNKSKKRTKPNSKHRSAPESKAQKHGGYESDALDEAGTGYGEDRYAPTRRVHFKAKRKPAVKHIIKYEWKETLCELGVTYCGRRYRNNNRLWNNERHGQYAPPPPSRRYRYYGQGIR